MGIGKRKTEPDFDSKDMVFPPLKPILTVCPQLQQVIFNKKNEECANEGCETPKCEENKIPQCLECPPAPRKPRATVKRKQPSGDFFFVHADLDSVFFPYQIIKPRKKIHWSTATTRES